MRILTFIFREGSSLVFALFIIGFALLQLPFLQMPHNAVGMFFVAMASLLYLGLQMAMAGFSKVGDDRPTLDFFLSFFPVISLIVIGVLAVVGIVDLTLFHVMGLTVMAAVVLMDIVLNTQIVFKINRLATDFVQMR